MSIHIGTDTDINQAIWSATDYLYSAGGTARRAILILTDNMQETRVPDSLVDEQLSYSGVVLDGLLFRGAIALPHISHPGILGFARNTGGEIVEGTHPESRVAEMIRRIKLRYAIHFRPGDSTSPRPRRIGVELIGEARGRYPDAVIRARKIYFPFAALRHNTAIPPEAGIARSNRTPFESSGRRQIETEFLTVPARETDDFGDCVSEGLRRINLQSLSFQLAYRILDAVCPVIRTIVGPNGVVHWGRRYGRVPRRGRLHGWLRGRSPRGGGGGMPMACSLRPPVTSTEGRRAGEEEPGWLTHQIEERLLRARRKAELGRGLTLVDRFGPEES